MCRVIRLLPLRQVALRVPAVRRRNLEIVIVVDVAGSARHIRVAVGQQESRRSVIEIRRVPALGRVAIGAVRNGKSRASRGVHRIARLLPLRQVTLRISAIRRRNLKVVIGIDVAGEARHVRMAIRQREPGGIVVKSRAQPAVRGVARFAGGSELRAHMVRIHRLLILLQVTRSASGREALILADGRALVAILALHRGVRTEKRKTILVLLHLLDGDIPALNGVAARAIRAHLPLVDIGVTILAVLARIGEHWLAVALRALHLFVHAAKGILGLIVVELGNGANGTPARGGMTVLTRNRERSMRTPSGLPLERWYGSIGWLPRKEQEPAENLDKCMRNCPLKFKLPTIRLRRPGVQWYQSCR